MVGAGFPVALQNRCKGPVSLTVLSVGEISISSGTGGEIGGALGMKYYFKFFKLESPLLCQSVQTEILRWPRIVQEITHQSVRKGAQKCNVQIISPVMVNRVQFVMDAKSIFWIMKQYCPSSPNSASRIKSVAVLLKYVMFMEPLKPGLTSACNVELMAPSSSAGLPLVVVRFSSMRNSCSFVSSWKPHVRVALDPFVAKVGSGGDCVMSVHSATEAQKGRVRCDRLLLYLTFSNFIYC